MAIASPFLFSFERLTEGNTTELSSVITRMDGFNNAIYTEEYGRLRIRALRPAVDVDALGMLEAGDFF